MIIKGGYRSGGAALGHYLATEKTNERATVLEIRGTVAKDLVGALKEMEAYGEGTKCENPLYHAMISPEPPYRLTFEQVIQTVDRTEKELGLTGQPRVIVAHEDFDREHFHVAWSRIDLENMRAIPDSHNFRKHEIVARELEREFGHPRVQGAHAERDGVERPERSPSRAELRQEERTGIKGKEVKAEVTALFLANDSPQEFMMALEDHGYVVAKGDKRDFVIVDRAGGDHSLARRIDGVKAAELRDFMAPIDRDGLPSVEEAKGIIEDRLRGGSEFDRQCWDDALAASAINRAKSDEAIRERNAADAMRSNQEHDAAALAERKWEDALATSAIEKAGRGDELDKERRRQRTEDKKANSLEKSYAQGDDFATQTEAATKDIKLRQKALQKIPTPRHPDDHRAPTLDNDFRDAADVSTRAEKSLAATSHDVALGTSTDRFDHNGWADNLYQAVRKFLFGDEGHEHSEQKLAADRRAQEIRDRNSANPLRETSNDKPLGDLSDSPTLADKNEEHYRRMQEILYDHDRDRRKEVEIGETSGDKKSTDRISNAFANTEMTEAQQQRMERLLGGEGGERAHSSERDDIEPDRQREAPGGGRTRSQ